MEIRLKTPELKIGNNIIKRKFSVKFLAVMLDGNISWKDIKTIEKKLARNIGFLYHTKSFLDEKFAKINRQGNSDIPAIINGTVKRPEHKYPTKFSKLTYTLRKYSFINSRFSISFRGPKRLKKKG